MKKNSMPAVKEEKWVGWWWGGWLSKSLGASHHKWSGGILHCKTAARETVLCPFFKEEATPQGWSQGTPPNAINASSALIVFGQQWRDSCQFHFKSLKRGVELVLKILQSFVWQKTLVNWLYFVRGKGKSSEKA